MKRNSHFPGCGWSTGDPIPGKLGRKVVISQNRKEVRTFFLLVVYYDNMHYLCFFGLGIRMCRCHGCFTCPRLPTQPCHKPWLLSTAKLRGYYIWCHYDHNSNIKYGCNGNPLMIRIVHYTTTSSSSSAPWGNASGHSDARSYSSPASTSTSSLKASRLAASSAFNAGAKSGCKTKSGWYTQVADRARTKWGLPFRQPASLCDHVR